MNIKCTYVLLLPDLSFVFKVYILYCNICNCVKRRWKVYFSTKKDVGRFKYDCPVERFLDCSEAASLNAEKPICTILKKAAF